MGAIVSLIIIWYGVIFGILDWISDIAYYNNTVFYNQSLGNACLGFIVIQPIFYIFLFIIYMASSPQIDNNKERFRMILISPLYALLQYTKVLAAHERVHDYFLKKFNIKENMKLITLENCFRVQIVAEFALENLPQMII